MSKYQTLSARERRIRNRAVKYGITQQQAAAEIGRIDAEKLAKENQKKKP